MPPSLAPPAGRDLVLTVDAMVAGVHFLPDDPPDLVARKLLRVNLSDLAAKGAVPLGYLMTVSTPRSTPDDWFAGFAAGLAADQAAFGITLLGGDTTSTPGPVSLSLTAIGHVAPGAMVRRTGAAPGDGVWVTGTIGDGALGLAVAQGRLADPSGELLGRYLLPQPRLGLATAGVASAGMDVSDGLVQDLGHLCRAGRVGAGIERRSCAAVGTGARGGAGLAGHLPDRWRRLRTAAGRPARTRGRVARRGRRRRRAGHPDRCLPCWRATRYGPRTGWRADDVGHRRMEPFLSRPKPWRWHRSMRCADASATLRP